MSRYKQLKTILMDKKLRESTNLCVKIMNSKQQVKGKLGHMVQVKTIRARPMKTPALQASCYRVVLQKFIVTVELLYDQAESDFVQCHTKMRAFASRICSEFKQIELN